MENSSLRVRNDRGGFDLTAEGWEKMAQIVERQAAATARVAAALRKGGRLSVDFKNAQREWQAIMREGLDLAGDGQLFDVAIRPKSWQ